MAAFVARPSYTPKLRPSGVELCFPLQGKASSLLLWTFVPGFVVCGDPLLRLEAQVAHTFWTGDDLPVGKVPP